MAWQSRERKNHKVAEPNSDQQLEDTIQKISSVESELSVSIREIIQRDTNMYRSDMYLIGAARRTLAQARGFRDLIRSKNFPCAAAVLRLQIDTAMRINGLNYVNQPQDFIDGLLAGKQYNKQKNKNGERLTDAFLRAKLNETYPWVDTVYQSTSDLVHLSPRHFFTSLASFDQSTGMVEVDISGYDPQESTQYYEITQCFYETTRIAAALILAFLDFTHQGCEGQI